MIGVFSPRQLEHSPAREMHNGGWIAHAETPARAEAIVAALPLLLPPRDFGLAPIARVHAAEYLDFLREAHALWRAAGREGDALPYVWPVVGRRPLTLSRIDALLGRFSFDAATPIATGTWDAAYWGAQTALTALAPLLNNAAIAAQAARDAGHSRVTMLDLDYHHGNGSQDIFLDDPSVFYVSIHADPATDYPFYWGHADETGDGAGRGATLNLPLPRGTGRAPYLAALDVALTAVARFDPGVIVVSFGADTFAGDPISGFVLATADYPEVAARVTALGVPTLIVMEGGYATAELGANVAAFLAGFGGDADACPPLRTA